MTLAARAATTPKTILITGSTDGIGLETAKMLCSDGHTVLLHGRSPGKLADAGQTLAALPGGGSIESYVADLSRLADVEALAEAVTDRHKALDVLINNAGVFKTPAAVTAEGRDVRFVVNAIAPYLLTKRLLALLGSSGRVITVSSAAQSPVDLKALAGKTRLGDMPAYAQSKLALTMWSRHLAEKSAQDGPTIIAVNPGSMLGSKMVRDGFGVAGGDIGVGARILVRAALFEEFGAASGQYFDNDNGRFAPPHPDALDARKCTAVVSLIEDCLGRAAGPTSGESP